jgi:hypothetical protein
MDELVVVAEDVPVQVFLDESENVLKQGIEGRLLAADDRDPETRALEKVLVSDFGGGDLELLANPRLQAPHDHPLLLESTAAGKVEIEDRVADDHAEFPDGASTAIP